MALASESKQQRVLLFTISLVAAIGGFLFGYDTGVISSAILFIHTEYSLSQFDESLIIAIVALGAMGGALLGGRLADTYGRKKIVLLSSICFIISALILALAPNVSMIVIGRLLVGISIGVASATAPIYIAELAPRSIRGMLVTMNQLAITIGILASYIFGLALSETQDWRFMFGFAAIPAALQLIIMAFFPESPRFLALNGKGEEAKQILKRFRASEQDAELEYDHIMRSHSVQQVAWKELFKTSAKFALIAGVGLTVIQQVTGINTIIYFAPTIFKLAGYAENRTAILATAIVGSVNVLMTFVAIYLLDRIGRKPLLITGLGGMVAALFLLGMGFFFPTSEATGYLTLCAMVAYIAFFAYSLGPIAWLINSEIYPLRVRGRANGIATCANWITNFLVTFTFLPLISLIGKSGTFWLYGIVGIFGLWFIIKLVPETKNKSLEKIEDFFTSRHSLNDRNEID